MRASAGARVHSSLRRLVHRVFWASLTPEDVPDPTYGRHQQALLLTALPLAVPALVCLFVVAPADWQLHPVSWAWVLLAVAFCVAADLAIPLVAVGDKPNFAYFSVMLRLPVLAYAGLDPRLVIGLGCAQALVGLRLFVGERPPPAAGWWCALDNLCGGSINSAAVALTAIALWPPLEPLDLAVSLPLLLAALFVVHHVVHALTQTILVRPLQWPLRERLLRNTGGPAALVAMCLLMSCGLAALEFDHWLMPALFGVPLWVAAMARRQAELSVTRRALERRELILASIARAGGAVFNRGGLDEQLRQVLAEIGEAAGVSRTYLLEQERDPDGGGLSWRLRDEWAVEPTLATLEGEQLQRYRIDGSPFEAWQERLRAGEAVVSGSADLSPAAAMLELAQVRSLLAAPIFVGGELAGQLTLVETRRERSWSAAELDSVRAVATMLGSALERQRDSDALAAQQQLLQQAQKLEAVGTLAGGLAHDVNNLLQVMRASTWLLRRHLEPGAEATEALDDLDEAGARAAELTTQLLTFARRRPVEIVPVGPARALANVGRMLQPVLPASVELVVCAEESLVPVAADAGQLEQLLLNLALNGRDAMLPDGGTLSLSAQADGEMVLLRVGDSGSGISEEVRASLFDPFFTTKEHGTGLGLAVVYGIVQGLGGSIGVESSPGEGTQFSVRLPAWPFPARSSSG